MNNIKQEDKIKYSFGRLIFTELRFSLTITKIVGMLIGVLIIPFVLSFLGLLIVGFRGNELIRQYLELDNLILFHAASGAVAVVMFSRVMMSVREKSTVDKNKSAFLYFGKNKVTFAKLLVESVMFSIAFFMMFAIAMAIGEGKKGNINEKDFIIKMFQVFPGYLVLYLFAYTFAKWAISYIPKKGLAYGAALLISAVIFSPIWILNQLPWTTSLLMTLNQGTLNIGDADVKDVPSFVKIISGAKSEFNYSNWFNSHQMVTTFIPILDFGIIGGYKSEIPFENFKSYPPLANSGIDLSGLHNVNALEHDWYTLIPMIYMVIGMGAVWNLQSAAQKRFLAAS